MLFLRKALYGLGQAPWVRYEDIDGYLQFIEFRQPSEDRNLYLQPGVLLLLQLTGFVRIDQYTKITKHVRPNAGLQFPYPTGHRTPDSTLQGRPDMTLVGKRGCQSAWKKGVLEIERDPKDRCSVLWYLDFER